MYFRVVSSVLGIFILLSQGVASANNQGGAGNQASDDRQRPQGPPREAVEACNGKKAGDTATLKNREGSSMKAVCRLIAVPEHAPAPQ
jgi:hypothetical protein